MQVVGGTKETIPVCSNWCLDFWGTL